MMISSFGLQDGFLLPPVGTGESTGDVEPTDRQCNFTTPPSHTATLAPGKVTLGKDLGWRLADEANKHLTDHRNAGSIL